MSEWLLFNAKWAILFIYIMARTNWFSIKWWWCPLCTVLDQHAELDFYSASWLKQRSSDRHVAPLGHIILIPGQPVFALSPECCVLSGEATNTNFLVFGLTLSGLESTIYRTRGGHANHYATDVVHPLFEIVLLLSVLQWIEWFILLFSIHF